MNASSKYMPVPALLEWYERQTVIHQHDMDSFRHLLSDSTDVANDIPLARMEGRIGEQQRLLNSLAELIVSSTANIDYSN